MAYTKLSNKPVGSIVKLNEAGNPVDFYVVKHNYENSLNGTGRTLLVRKECHSIRQWHTTYYSAYASSDIDAWLNSTYKSLLDVDILEAVSTTKLKYIPSGGYFSDATVSTLERSVFLLSASELNVANSWDIADGSELDTDIVSTLKIAYMNGAAVDQWTRSPCIGTNGENRMVWELLETGSARGVFSSLTAGARPAFTLPETLFVAADGTVTLNVAPTITSSTANGSNLGTKTAGFNFQYTVNDVDGDTVTVKEYLDNVLKRTYTATLGQVNTFQAVTAANWQKILNGSHTLKVVANDGKADGTAYTVTFTKKVTKAIITLETPLSADDAISLMVMSITGSLPSDAKVMVHVTNNANDPAPVWDNATADIKNGGSHTFTNKTATKGFAFNFKVTVERGASDTGGYISSIGGVFD